MAETKILIPIVVEAKPFEALETNGIEKALTQCLEAGYSPLFMPQVVDGRIFASPTDYIAQHWFTTPSVRVTGRSRGGNAVVVYAHVPNPFSNPANIKIAREAGLVNGAGKIPLQDFYNLLELEDGQRVYVVDHKTLQSSESGVIEVSKAMKHPQTIPFLGGQDRAEKYLAKHEEFYGDTIGIWHSDDLGDVPQGRPLFVGYGCNFGLVGDYLDGSGRVLGVVAAEPPHKGVVREAPRENGNQTLDAKVLADLSAGKAFMYGGRLYAPVSAENLKL